jgi:type VI secretion system protein ImpM
VCAAFLNALGYYGKVPSRRDFAQANLPHPFVKGWDCWLRMGLQSSREQLGDGWLQSYLESPVWRFALAADSCGPTPMAGVFMPSMDAVGRYFPFTLAAVLPSGTLPASLWSCSDWYDEAESLARRVLEQDLLIVEEALFRFDAPLPSCVPRGRMFRFGDATESTKVAIPRLLAELPLVTNYTLFWSDGSPRITPSLLLSVGLPLSGSFAALLNGEWERRGWQELAP